MQKGYEEVIVPAAANSAKSEDDLISIDNFNDWAQVAFQG